MGRTFGVAIADGGGKASPLAGTVFGGIGAGRAAGMGEEGCGNAPPGAATVAERAAGSRLGVSGATALVGAARLGAGASCVTTSVAAGIGWATCAVAGVPATSVGARRVGAGRARGTNCGGAAEAPYAVVAGGAVPAGTGVPTLGEGIAIAEFRLAGE